VQESGSIGLLSRSITVFSAKIPTRKFTLCRYIPTPARLGVGGRLVPGCHYSGNSNGCHSVPCFGETNSFTWLLGFSITAT
jgi:hypothetical protein